MTSFLLVSIRPEDEAIDAEYRAFLSASGLNQSELEQVRLDMIGLPDVEVTDFDGVIIAGAPYGMTTPEDFKTPTQERAESEVRRLITKILDAKTPCLTTGYGTEVATEHMGGLVTTTWAEEAQLAEILLTSEGIGDPLLCDFPRSFLSYVNHHEAIEKMPEGGVVLARSIGCPVQIARFADNFYATQFNPELDSDSIGAALERWEDAGYPGTDDIDYLLIIGREGEGKHQAGKIVSNFVERYRGWAAAHSSGPVNA